MQMQIITDKSQKEIKQHGSPHFPLLISAERLSRYESGAFLWHWHPEIELTLVLSGEIAYSVNSQTFLLKSGQALFGNVNTLHSGRMHEQQDAEYISVTFDKKLLYGYEESAVYQKYVAPITQDMGLAAIVLDLSEPWHEEGVNLLQSIIERGKKKDECMELDVLCLLLSFWKLLVLNRTITPLNDRGEQVNYGRIREMVRYIQEHYAGKITLEEIAEHVHICRSECSRIFAKYMKTSLFEYILQYRIERSLPLLMDMTLNITEVAQKVGFNDSNYFSKVFTREKGCSPSRFRKGSFD